MGQALVLVLLAVAGLVAPTLADAQDLGTGRFAGIKGEGTYRGERLGALQTGDYVYVDTTGSCTIR